MNEKIKKTGSKKVSAAANGRRNGQMRKCARSGVGNMEGGKQGRTAGNYKPFAGLSGIALTLPKIVRIPEEAPATSLILDRLETFLQKIIPHHFRKTDNSKTIKALERWTNEFFPSSNQLGYKLIIDNETSAIMDCDNGGYVQPQYGDNNFAGLSCIQDFRRSFLVGPALTMFQKQKRGLGRDILTCLKTEGIISLFTPDMARDAGHDVSLLSEYNAESEPNKEESEIDREFKKQIPKWSLDIGDDFGTWNGKGPKELIADMNMLHDCRAEWKRLLEDYKFHFPDPPGFIPGILLRWVEKDEDDYMLRFYDDIENEISNEWNPMQGYFMFEIVLDPQGQTVPQLFKSIFETWLKSMEILVRILTQLANISKEIIKKEKSGNESISQ